MSRHRHALAPFLAPALIGLAAGLTLIRWLVQGSGNLYSQPAKRLYVPDPDLEWRLLVDGPPWLGLDAVAALAGLGVAALIAALLVRRRERRRSETYWPWRILLAIGLASLALPVWAFARGLGPDGSQEALPGELVEAPGDGVTGELAGLPAGTYQVLQHPGSVVSAGLHAGGEEFEARFAGGVRGSVRLDPGDLTQPLSAVVEVGTASIDTGIDLRNEHARKDLDVTRHPVLRFELRRLLGAGQQGPQAVTFHATGEVAMMGRRQPIDVTGVLKAVDGPGRARLGLPADRAVMVAQASFQVLLDRTPIGDNGGTFTENRVPVKATLVLQQPGGAAAQPNDGRVK